jgi:hypothetical protein
MVARFTRQGRSGGGKPKKPRVTQGQLERLVTAADAAQHLKAHDRDEIKRRLKRERKNLRRDVPSQPWFDAKWENGEQFPPGGDVTRMERCTCCERYTPPNCIGSSGACDDCRYAAMSKGQLEHLPGSPGSVIDMARLNASRRRGESYPA